MDLSVLSVSDRYESGFLAIPVDWWKSNAKHLIPLWVEQMTLMTAWCKHIHPSDEPVITMFGSSINGEDLVLEVYSPVAGLISTLDIKLINHQNKKGSSYPKLILKEIYEN